MFRSPKRAVGTVLLLVLALVLAACSATGGKRAARGRRGRAATSVAAGDANTPHYTIAMITHAAPGDTFWDIILAGRERPRPPRTTSRSSTPVTPTPPSRPS